jgi:hypothetical protein
MTPGEVKGLQALAMSQGGSLTINPETGLPEAGILKSLLPMIAGFFLGPAGIGLTAMQAGLTVGALGTAATGSLGKGFMMGLGAYGGAGLGAGLTAAGTPASVTPSVANPTLGGFAQNPALANAGTGSATTLGTDTFANVAKEAGVNSTTGGLNSLQGFNAKSIMAPNAAQSVPSWATTTPVSPTVVTPSVQTPVFDISKYASPNNAGFTNIGEVSQITPGSLVNATPNVPITNNVVDLSKQGISDLASTTKSNLLPQSNMSLPGGRETLIGGEMSVPRSPFVEPQAYVPSNLEKAGEGFKRATGSWEGAKEVWNATPTGTGYGLAATGMGVLQAQQEEAAEEAKAKADAMAASRRGTIRPYEFSTELTENAFAPRESSSEFKYYEEPRFIARPIEKIAKEGGLMSLAVGGQVEEMSAANAMGANTGYPMANLQTPMYANPTMARPVPTNVISPSGDTGVNTYSGEMRMALGGSATAKAKEPTTDTKYSYNPETMQYTQATTVTPAASNNMQDAVRDFYAPVLGRLPGQPYSGVGGNSPYAMGSKIGSGAYFGLTPGLLKSVGVQQSAPQPTTTTQTLGGTIAPYTPQTGLAAADMSMIPNIQMQPRQDINQQLGLEAFYPMMEQQLALKGSNLQAQGYADGGIASFGGGGAIDPRTAEQKARQAYAAENSPGIYKSVSDKEWEREKKLSNLSFPSAASAAPAYNYNPATMQYTDNAGKVTGGMEQAFMPPMMIQQLTPEEQIGLTGYQGYAEGGTANGGYSLGSYSDGGRLLRGPGDGVSDSIPASIGDRQPARLADGEFVVPARIVSEIGNGSTEAGARKLYAMMDRVQKARKKTVGKSKVAVNTRADKLLPA